MRVEEDKEHRGHATVQTLSHHLQSLSLCSDDAINHADTPNGRTQESGVT